MNEPIVQWENIEASFLPSARAWKEKVFLGKVLPILIKIIKLQRRENTEQRAWNKRRCYRNRKSTRQGFLVLTNLLLSQKEKWKENAIHFVTLTSCKVTLMIRKNGKERKLFLISLVLVFGRAHQEKREKKKSKSSNQFSIIIIDILLLFSSFFRHVHPSVMCFCSSSSERWASEPQHKKYIKTTTSQWKFLRLHYEAKSSWNRI